MDIKKYLDSPELLGFKVSETSDEIINSQYDRQINHAREALGLYSIKTGLDFTATSNVESTDYNNYSGENVRSNTDGLKNGFLTDSDLKKLPNGIKVNKKIYNNVVQMLNDYYQETGRHMVITDGYRSYAQQVAVKKRKGRLAATPGTSQHGYGLALDIDVSNGVYKWLVKNASKYNLINFKEESWHWSTTGH